MRLKNKLCYEYYKVFFLNFHFSVYFFFLLLFFFFFVFCFCLTRFAFAPSSSDSLSKFFSVCSLPALPWWPDRPPTVACDTPPLAIRNVSRPPPLPPSHCSPNNYAALCVCVIGSDKPPPRVFLLGSARLRLGRTVVRVCCKTDTLSYTHYLYLYKMFSNIFYTFCLS